MRRSCNNTRQTAIIRSRLLRLVGSQVSLSLTCARYGPKNIFVQAGVQEGAGPGRGHQSVTEKRVFSSVLKGKDREKVIWRP